jgi:Domain of unknown function (DUF4159)
MKVLARLRWIACALLLACALYGVSYAQRPFRQYPSVEYGWGEIPLPAGYNKPSEWTFARLMFPPGPLDGYRGRFDGPWQLGLSLWTQDYPRADRHFAEAVRRLTLLDARSAEQPVMLEGGNDVYNWPFLYAVQVGEWGLNEQEAKILREYLLRGGFFMADDCWGPEEHAYFVKTMKMVFPNRPLVDIPDNDPIFHTVYDVSKRFRITGQEHLNTGYKNGGVVPRWQAIRDDKGRIMVAFDLNSDIGDSWEWADDPRYPEKFSNLGMRIGINYIVYAMTH